MNTFENENIEVKEEVLTALVKKKKLNKGWIIVLKDKEGGPVISGLDLEETKNNFKRALRLSMAMRNLTEYKKAVDEPTYNAEWDKLADIKFEFLDSDTEIWDILRE